MIRQFIVVCLCLCIYSCIEIAAPFDKIPPGIWRAELELQQNVKLPFNFDISYDDQDSMVMTIINGEEKIEVRNIEFGKNKKLLDTVRVIFPIMDSYIKGVYKENIIEGYWSVNYRENYRVPFVAHFGQAHRFSLLEKTPISNLSGKWETIFEVETEDEYPAVAELTQNEQRLSGTFNTETGDYRYLDGEVQGDKLSLSCFDGSHAFLFKADIKEEGTLIGKFYSGSHYETNWIATKNDEAELADPYELSKPSRPNTPLNFSLVNTEGELISPSDTKYKNKPKLVMLMGTWCPNCLDESKFILEYLNDNPEIDIEVIAVAFERYRDETKALKSIKNYKKRLNIPYDIVYGGYYDKAEATEKFQYIDEIISYPTLLFLNDDNIVTKVHTGFAGPATSKYMDFKEEFDAEVKRLMQ